MKMLLNASIFSGVVCGVSFGFFFFFNTTFWFFLNGGHERQDELSDHPSQLPLSKGVSLKEKKQQNKAA